MIPSRIVAFGSSSVYGRGDPEQGGFVGRLRSWFEPQESSNCVFNLGVGGDTSAGMLKRFESEVSFRRPGLILLYPGLNDTRRSDSSQSPTATAMDVFASNLQQLSECAMRIAPTVFISAFPIDENRTLPWNGTRFFYLKTDADAFSRIGRELCESLEIPYLPIYETWASDADVKSLSVDGLHGTPEAHQRLFLELRTLLLEEQNL